MTFVAQQRSEAKQLPELRELKPKERRFVNEYVNNGGNATQAYLVADPNAKPSSAGQQAYRLLKNDQNKRAIIAVMEQHGVTSDAVAARVRDQLESTDGWTVNEGIKHSRAILGLDAPKEQNINKQELNVNINFEETTESFKGLLAKVSQSEEDTTSK